MSVGVASCVSPGKIIHFLHGDYLFERLAVDSSACKATVAFVVTEVDSIHSQQTCTKNYNQTEATFSQTHNWPVAVVEAAIHIILLARTK